MSGGNALTIKVDTAALSGLAGKLAAAGNKAPQALARAINHTGDKAKTAMGRALVKQTGLKYATMNRALRPLSATAGSLTYTIKARGGNVSLRYFKPKETRPGVTAAPWNRRRLYAGTFMKAGWWPRRVTKPGWHGQVFARTGDKTETGMDKFQKQRSGLFIPREMVTGKSRQAFDDTVATNLPGRLAHELGRVFGGR